ARALQADQPAQSADVPARHQRGGALRLSRAAGAVQRVVGALRPLCGTGGVTMLTTDTIPVNGVATHPLQGGKSGDAAALSLHGGSSGATPFASGVHVWGQVLDAFAAERPVTAIDLPGSGRTPALTEVLTIDALGKHVAALIDAAGAGPCHVVGHDEG